MSLVATNVISRTILIIIKVDSARFSTSNSSKSRNQITKTEMYLYENYVDH